MAEYKTDLTGWKAVAAFVVLIVIFGVRVMTFNDKKGDTDLMREVEILLICDYLPDDAERLKAVLASGDTDMIDQVATSVTSTRLNIEALQTSYPLLNFSTRKKVVVKVTYSLMDASGPRKSGTKYYIFRHGSIGNSWQYRYEASSISYYLNFF